MKMEAASDSSQTELHFTHNIIFP